MLRGLDHFHYDFLPIQLGLVHMQDGLLALVLVLVLDVHVRFSGSRVLVDGELHLDLPEQPEDFFEVLLIEVLGNLDHLDVDGHILAGLGVRVIG